MSTEFLRNTEQLKCFLLLPPPSKHLFSLCTLVDVIKMKILLASSSKSLILLSLFLRKHWVL